MEIAFILKEENGVDNGKILMVAESEWLYEADALCVFEHFNNVKKNQAPGECHH